MVFCFFCDEKLYREVTRVSSNTTPHSNVPYPGVIDELVGDIYPIIVKPTDQLCKNCTSLMTRMDTLDTALKIIESQFWSNSQNKFETLSPDQTINSVKVKQQKKIIYECQVCSMTFDSPINCLDHIAKYHNLPTPSTSNGERETEDSCPVTTRVKKLESLT